MSKKIRYMSLEESTLWEKFKVRSDMFARDELVRRYISYAEHHAAKLHNGYLRSIEFDELCSHAYLGLLDAVNRFDPSKNIKFSTYAHRRIVGAIIDEARKQAIISRGTRSKLKLFSLFLSTCPEYGENEVDDQLLAKECGLKTFEYQQYKNPYTLSIDSMGVISPGQACTEHQEDQNNLDSLGVPSKSEDPSTTMLTTDLREKLDMAMSELSDRNKSIITDIFYSDIPLRTIAKKHNITPCAIFQIRKKSLSIIKMKATQLNLSSYLHEAC